jgi:aminoglycoside phosphotransferase (APT) family kinase protein
VSAIDPVTSDHRLLVARLFPELAIETFAPVGDGWTSFTYDVNGAWIVQLPRNPYAAERLRMQAAFLPQLAREVPAPVPVPELTSDDPLAIAYRRLDGTPATEAADGPWPERLGRFLADLHAVRPELVGMRAVTPGALRVAERLAWAAVRAEIAGVLAPADLTLLDGELAGLLDDDDKWAFAPCLTHNDLGPAHVLVGPGGDLTGVIDWEEASVGDPASDLAWWLHEMPSVGERALAAYGGAPDRAFRERARLRFALAPWHDVRHGVRSDRPAFVIDGLAGARARLP